MRATIDTIVADPEFGGPDYVRAVAPAYDVATMFNADKLHRNDAGHARAAQRIVEQALLFPARIGLVA
jgi:hypothetical protein